MAKNKYRSVERSARSYRARPPAALAGRRSLPYDPLSDPQRVFSLFGGREIPPPRRLSSVRTLIRTVVGDTKRRSVRSPEFRFTRLMNSAFPLGRPSLCDRRRSRREVIFAKSLTGKGARARRVHTSDSFINCRR